MQGFVSLKILRRKRQSEICLSEDSSDFAAEWSSPSRSTYFNSHYVRLLFVADYVAVVEVYVCNGHGFSSGRAQRKGMQRVS